MSRENILHLQFYIVLLIISLIGFGAVLYSTVWGAGWMSDSFQYVSSASNFAKGKGLSYILGYDGLIPMTHYPPMYSFVLSIFEILGIDVVEGARLLNAALLGVNAFLVGVSIRMITVSNVFSWIGAGIVAISGSAVEVHSWVLSEPLYLCFSLLGMITLGAYIKRRQQDSHSHSVGLLVVSAILAGFAFLTRYVGLSIVATGLLGLVLLTKKPWRQNMLDVLAWSFFSIMPMALWTVRNYRITETLSDRSLELYLLTSKNIGVFVNTVLTWWLPASIVNGSEKFLAIGGVVLVLVFLIYITLNRSKSMQSLLNSNLRLPSLRHPVFQIHILYLLLYVVLVLVSKTLLEAGMGMSDRMLLPLYLSGVVIVICLLHSVSSDGNKIAQAITLLVCAYLLIFNSFETMSTVKDLNETGLGVSKRRWHESSVIQYLRELQDIPIYTNAPSIVYLWTRGGSYPIKNFNAQSEEGSLEESVIIVFSYLPVSNRTVRITQELELLKSDNLASIYLYKP